MLNMVPAPFTESHPRFVPVWSTSLVRSKSNLDYCFQNILAGALYGLSGGLAFVCIFTAVGATLAYLLSRTFYREGIHKLFPDKFRAIELKRSIVLFHDFHTSCACQSRVGHQSGVTTAGCPHCHILHHYINRLVYDTYLGTYDT